MFFFLCLVFTIFSSVTTEQPQVTFSVTPKRFVFDVPFNAHCKINNFNTTGKNYEVSFWMLTNVSNIKNPVKTKIGTYLVINSGNIKFNLIAIFNKNF